MLCRIDRRTEVRRKLLAGLPVRTCEIAPLMGDSARRTRRTIPCVKRKGRWVTTLELLWAHYPELAKGLAMMADVAE